MKEIEKKVTSDYIVKRVVKEFNLIDFKALEISDFVSTSEISRKFDDFICDNYIFSREIWEIVDKINASIDEENEDLDEDEKIENINEDDFLYDLGYYGSNYYDIFTYASLSDFLKLYEYQVPNAALIADKFDLDEQLCEILINSLDEFIWQEYQKFEKCNNGYDFYYAKFIQEHLEQIKDFISFLIDTDSDKAYSFIARAIKFDKDFKYDINATLDEVEKDKDLYSNLYLKHQKAFVDLLDRNNKAMN